MTNSRLLFIDKVFLKNRKAVPLRGVELFNLNLVRDLCHLGYHVTLIVESSWQPDIEAYLGERPYTTVSVTGFGPDFINGLRAARSVSKKYDACIVGNVGRSVLPTLNYLHRKRSFAKCILIAHREANERFVQTMTTLSGHVLAVNEVIAKPFREAGCPSVHVDYGILNADNFHPCQGERKDSHVVKFCVVGMLDNAWKGADTAVKAFRMVPPTVREHCELHLCSFSTPPRYDEPNIRAYAWMDAADLPEWLRGMDVMLVPSRDEEVMRETFSQVTVQGMLTGLPIIVSDLPILREKAEPDCGIVFHNAEELSKAMESLASDSERRKALGNKGRAAALERYVWDTARFARRYIDG